jgi:transcriptional regulator with XRE-family HTH domain
MGDRKKIKLAIVRNPRSVGKLDVHFGEKLRARRLTMVPKVSLDDLAKALGISLQQVQKYEKGVNRMSGAIMTQIAAVLKVSVQYFFDDLPNAEKNYKEIKRPSHIEMLFAAHGPRLITAFLNLKSDEQRGLIADLASQLAKGHR